MATSSDGNGVSAAHPFAIGADPALSARVRQELIDTLSARTNFDPVEAGRELDRRDIREEFVLEFGDLGLDPDRLPDLLAAHLIAMWCVVHDAPLPRREVAEGLTRQFTGMLATSPQAADPAMRQMMGEALRYEAVLTVEARRAARDAGDKAKLREMAESAQGNLLKQRGINLRKTRLTASGMMRA